MVKIRNKVNNPVVLYGLTFIAPVVYSLTLQEMDNLQKIIFSGLALIVVLRSALSSDIRIQHVNFNRFLLLIILLFPLSFFISFINNSSTYLPLLLTNLLAPFCVVFLTVTVLHILGEKKFLVTISLSVVTISTLIGFVGLLEVFQIEVIPLPTIIPPGSIFGHRSFAVEFLIPALPFFLILTEYIKKDYYPLLLSAAFITLSFILFTRSRSAIIALGVISLFFFFHSLIINKRFVKKIIFVSVLVVMAFTFSLLPAKGAERTNIKEAAETLFDTQFRSNRLRLNYWDASLRMISEKPLTGIGLYNWAGTYPWYYGEGFSDQNVSFVQSIHAHNDFLELFAENGAIAPLLYMLLILYILKTLYLKSKVNPSYFYILLSVVGTVFFSLVAFPFYKFSSQYLLCVGTGIALYFGHQENAKSIKVGIKKIYLITSILLLILFLASILKIKNEYVFIEGIQYFRIKDYVSMREKLNKISDILYPTDPSKQPVDYYRGIANYYLGDYSEALNNNLNAQKISPYNPIVLRNIARSYQSIGELRKSEEMYEKIKELFPNYLSPQINLLYLYSDLGEIEKGIELYELFKKKFPNDPRLQEFEKKFQLE